LFVLIGIGGKAIGVTLLGFLFNLVEKRKAIALFPETRLLSDSSCELLSKALPRTI
jgi:hypothetical protein